MAREANVMTKDSAKTPRANLVQADKALESWRDAGFDLSTAAGEPVDNSIEAKATLVRIRMDESYGHKKHKKIDRIIFADNGIGITPDTLPHVLSLGFSTRYGAREGLGRFGVGLKLAALSQARRIELYTRPYGSDRYYYTVLDLDDVAEGSQEYLEATEVEEGYPEDLMELMCDEKGTEFPSGTLIIWSKVDRLTTGGPFGTSLDQKRQDLIKFLARAYRLFIDKGFIIELNGKRIDLDDPLFLLDMPRIIERYGDLKGKIIEETSFDIDGHNVEVVVTLCPEEFRPRRRSGGVKDTEDRDIRFLHIPENERKVSILRNGREIYYAVVPMLYPASEFAREIDRYIGVQISFPAALDQYFQVRNVKRGAEPVSKLREELRGWLKRPIKAARKEIQEHWGKVDMAERKKADEHERATSAVSSAEQTSPRGRAGIGMGPEEVDDKFQDLFDDLGVDSQREPERAEQIKRKVEEQPITLVDGDWPGKELFDITHLNGKAIVRFNYRHPFFREIYTPMKELAARDYSEVRPDEAVSMAQRIEVALDVLFMAYAKAENMHEDPETAYSDLRTDWGKFTQAYVREALKGT